MAGHQLFSSVQTVSSSNGISPDRLDYPYSNLISQETWGRMVSIKPPQYTFIDQVKEWFKGTSLYRKLISSRCIVAIKCKWRRQDELKTIHQVSELSKQSPEEQKAYLENAIQRNDFLFIRGVIRHNLIKDMYDSNENRYKGLADTIIETLSQTLEQSPEKIQKLLSQTESAGRKNFYTYLIRNQKNIVLINHLIPKLWHKHRSGKIEEELSSLVALTADREIKVCSMLTNLFNNTHSWNIGKAVVLINSVLFSEASEKDGLGQHDCVDNEHYIDAFKELTYQMIKGLSSVQNISKKRSLITFIDTLQRITSCLVEQRVGNYQYKIPVRDNYLLDQETGKVTPAKLTDLMERLSPGSSQQTINDELKAMFGWEPLAEERIEGEILHAEPHKLGKSDQLLVIQDFMWRFFTSIILNRNSNTSDSFYPAISRPVALQGVF